MFVRTTLTLYRPMRTGPDAWDRIQQCSIEVSGKVESHVGQYVCVLDPLSEKLLITAEEVKQAEDDLIAKAADIDTERRMDWGSHVRYGRDGIAAPLPEGE